MGKIAIVNRVSKCPYRNTTRIKALCSYKTGEMSLCEYDPEKPREFPDYCPLEDEGGVS